MLIQEALKETGKAIHKTYKHGFYVQVNERGVLQWHSSLDNIGTNLVAYDAIIADVWQPYHEVKEIRPEKEGELWQDSFTKTIFFTYMEKNELRMMFRDGSGKGKVIENTRYNEMRHKEGDYTRIYPPVEDDSVEGIKIECPNCELKATLHGIDHISQILKLTCSCCGNEIPKEGK